jgi:DNA-binding transcriptional ArsR family regulator
MVRDPAPSENNPSLEAILNALDDSDRRYLLQETSEPTTANKLVVASGIPRSTVYRKLELLRDAGIIRGRDTINPGGGRTTKYERDFNDVTISMDNKGDFIVDVEPPRRSVDEELADIWSKMGEEL